MIAAATSLSKKALRLLVALLMLVAGTMPAFADVGCGDSGETVAISFVQDAGHAEASSPDDGGEPVRGEGACHVNHCAHSLAVRTPAVVGAKVAVAAPRHWSPSSGGLPSSLSGRQERPPRS